MPLACCFLFFFSCKGTFLVTDNRVFNKPLGRSLRPFARTAHSARLLHSALLRCTRFAALASLHSLRCTCFACSLRSRACSFTSLTTSWDSWNSWICVHTFIAFHGNTLCWRSLEKRPKLCIKSPSAVYIELYIDLSGKKVEVSLQRVRVGRGSEEIDQLDSLAGAVTPKPPVNAEKSKALRTDRPTNRPTDGQSGL